MWNFHPNSFQIIYYDFTQIIDIFNNFINARTVDFHQRPSNCTYSDLFQIDIIPNPIVGFQISNIHWKALLDTNPTVLVLGESDSRISSNVPSKSMVEIHELPRSGAFYSGHFIYNIYIYISSISF